MAMTGRGTKWPARANSLRTGLILLSQHLSLMFCCSVTVLLMVAGRHHRCRNSAAAAAITGDACAHVGVLVRRP